jgi:hypothetical protein
MVQCVSDFTAGGYRDQNSWPGSSIAAASAWLAMPSAV